MCIVNGPSRTLLSPLAWSTSGYRPYKMKYFPCATNGMPRRSRWLQRASSTGRRALTTILSGERAPGLVPSCTSLSPEDPSGELSAVPSASNPKRATCSTISSRASRHKALMTRLLLYARSTLDCGYAGRGRSLACRDVRIQLTPRTTLCQWDRPPPLGRHSARQHSSPSNR